MIHKYISDNLITEIKFEVIQYDIEYSNISSVEEYYINLYSSKYDIKNVDRNGGKGITH